MGAVDVDVHIGGEGIVVQTYYTRRVVSEGGERMTEQPVRFRNRQRERLGDV